VTANSTRQSYNIVVAAAVHCQDRESGAADELAGTAPGPGWGLCECRPSELE